MNSLQEMMWQMCQGNFEIRFIFSIFLTCEFVMHPNFLYLSYICLMALFPLFVYFLLCGCYLTVLWEFYYNANPVHQLCSYETTVKLSLAMLCCCDCTGCKGFPNIEEKVLNNLLTNSLVFLLKWLIYMRSFFVDFSFSYIYLSWHIFLKIQLPI